MLLLIPLNADEFMYNNQLNVLMSLPSTTYPVTWKIKSKVAPDANGSHPGGPSTLVCTKVKLIGSLPPKPLLTRLRTANDLPSPNSVKSGNDSASGHSSSINTFWQRKKMRIIKERNILPLCRTMSIELLFVEKLFWILTVILTFDGIANSHRKWSTRPCTPNRSNKKVRRQKEVHF